MSLVAAELYAPRRHRASPDRKRRSRAPLRLSTACPRQPPSVVVACTGQLGARLGLRKHLIEAPSMDPGRRGRAGDRQHLSRSLLLSDQFFLAISQSGRSHDLIETALSTRLPGP